MREQTVAVELEHHIRKYIQEATQHFDMFVERIDQQHLNVAVTYEHNSGDGLWTMYTYCSGAGSVDTKGAVLHATMQAHCAAIGDRYANRTLPSLLPAPVNTDTPVSIGEEEQD